MSFHKIVILIWFSTASFAQIPPAFGDSQFSGEIQSSGLTPLNTLYVELYDPRFHEVVERTSVSSDGRFRFYRAVAGSFYTIRIVTAPGEQPLIEEQRQMINGDPLVLRLPEPKTNTPPSGNVSILELNTRIPRKAIRAAADAERYSKAHETARAIDKLQQAIRIAPTFRDAHSNLGVQYARAGRMLDALTQFQIALEIGPPSAIIYSNLSMAYLTLGNIRDGEALARKALALEPKNPAAQKCLQYALAH